MVAQSLSEIIQIDTSRALASMEHVYKNWKFGSVVLPQNGEGQFADFEILADGEQQGSFEKHRDA